MVNLAAFIAELQMLSAFANKGYTCPLRDTANLGKCLQLPDSLCSRAHVEVESACKNVSSLVDTAALAGAS